MGIHKQSLSMSCILIQISLKYIAKDPVSAKPEFELKQKQESFVTLLLLLLLLLFLLLL